MGNDSARAKNTWKTLETFWSRLMDLQIVDVQAALARLLNHYPESGHNAATLSKLAFDWHDLLVDEGVTQNQFFHGIRHAAKTCRFFPKLADVLAGVTAYREKPTSQGCSTAMQLPEHTATAENWTPEEIARNKERIRMVLLVCHPDPSKRVSIEEAVDFIEAVGHVNDFSTMEAKQPGEIMQ